MKLPIVIVGVLIVLAVTNAVVNGPSPSYQSTSAYNTISPNDCITDPTLQYKVSQYQQKYPNLSKNQIQYILCK
jgi:hypothetical protein